MKKVLVTVAAMFSLTLANADLIQQFKNPTFSGQGWASHVLTVEQMRNSAKNSVDSKAAADAASLAGAAQNTPLAKFMALFTGQVYSQLATQLTNNLFKECVGAGCSNGNFMVSDTQLIRWVKTDGQVTLAVYDGKKDNGIFVANLTPMQTITVPVSSFSF